MFLNKIKNKKGLTFIELIITSLLSFIIISTVLDSIYNNRNDSYKLTESTKLKQDILFSSMIISKDLYKAGDLDYGLSSFSRSPFDWSQTGSYDSNNDELAIRFYNHDSTPDCSGVVNVGVTINHYQVIDDKLYCNDIELLENVARFNLIFGADLTGDGNIDRFVDRNTAYQINEETDQRIIAVKYNLLIYSEKDYNVTEQKSFDLVNGETFTITDNKHYEMLNRLILLRNML